MSKPSVFLKEVNLSLSGRAKRETERNVEVWVGFEKVTGAEDSVNEWRSQSTSGGVSQPM